jgi:hypothetical protein
VKVPRVTIAYIIALIVLGVLLYLTFLHPMVKGREYSVIKNESLNKADAGWTLQFTLANPFQTATAFEIRVQLDAQQPYDQDVTVPAGQSYGFMMPIPADEVKSDSKLQVDIYTGQVATPFEQETLDLNNS